MFHSTKQKMYVRSARKFKFELMHWMKHAAQNYKRVSLCSQQILEIKSFSLTKNKLQFFDKPALIPESDLFSWHVNQKNAENKQ